MSRTEINRSREMEVFVHVVQEGGFSAAARLCRMTPSAVSKLVARLERRLGARLVSRSTRIFRLTSEGCAFFERACSILADIEVAERSAAAGEQPAGRIRLNTSASYACHVLAPILPEFIERHPRVTLDIVQTDQVVDLLAERADVAVRAGPLKSSGLILRKLGEARMIIVAAPAYLRHFGEPRSVGDLERHRRIGAGYVRASQGWPLRARGRTIVVPAAGPIQASDGEGVRNLAIGGNGLARLPVFTVREDIAAGRLAPVLEEMNPGDTEPFHAIFAGGGPQPSRIRALLDFLAANGGVS